MPQKKNSQKTDAEMKTERVVELRHKKGSWTKGGS